MAPSLTEDEINAILRAFIVGILPAGTSVIIAQENRLPEPASANFVTITQASRQRLGYTVQDWDMSDGGNPATQTMIEPVSIIMQLDFHGDASPDNAQVFSALFRSDYAYQAMYRSGLFPDYCSDGQQMPFINGEDQWETRWVVKAVFDCCMAVIVPQQFADTVTVGLIEVDTVYPPT